MLPPCNWMMLACAEYKHKQLIPKCRLAGGIGVLKLQSDIALSPATPAGPSSPRLPGRRRGVTLLRPFSFFVGRQHGLWEASEVSALVGSYDINRVR